MGQKITLVDDFDGETEAVGILQFFLDGQEYEIDLGEKNMKTYKTALDKHKELLQKLADHGRPVRRDSLVKVQRGRTKAQLDEIRTWARANGHEVSDRGRIPEKVIDAYETRSRMPQKVEENKDETAKAGA